MNERTDALAVSLRLAADPGAALAAEAAAVGARIAAQLRAEAGAQAETTWGRVLGFLEGTATPCEPAGSSLLDTLAQTLGLCGDERTLLLLAGMADEHEGYAAAFAALHPKAESRASWGLFCWLLSAGPGRDAAWSLLHASPLLRLGIVRLVGDGPLPERSLHLADALWPALRGAPAWPAQARPLAAQTELELDDWLHQPNTQEALTLLRPLPNSTPGPAATVMLRGLQPAALRLRARQLAAVLGGSVFEWDAAREPALLSALLAHTLARGSLPVLLAEAPLPPAHWALLDACPGPLLLAGTAPGQAADSARALWVLDAPPLSAQAQARLWQQLLPELAEHGPMLASRYPVGPETLARLRHDLAPWLTESRPPPLARCVAALKARMARADESYARRLQPVATWDDLVLPADKLAALREGVARVRLQARVLDEWGFGGGSAGSGSGPRAPRGLRLLFSGLPGTGKTLAAEVIAQALHADLLVIDLARLVSKWIGETEKNLAAAFDQAEGTGAVLFFDEADALFGKRTEVGDAHDRYANIESAYLLSRLERFDGVAVLATNLRANLDRAFLRRFEIAIDFAEPGVAERAAIWRRQFPPAAPLAADIDFDALAAQHALPGALIRNAALGAAYLAAAGSGPVTRACVERALRQEYDKSGRVCPL
jgi:hypothetical protein